MEFNATLIVAFISFVVFTIIMNLILYKPLNKTVKERQEFIDKHYEEATGNKEKAKSILTDKSKKIEQSKHDAKSILTKKSEEAKAKKAALTTEAQQAATMSIDKAKCELHDSKNEAQNVLSSEVIGLAQDISSKILNEHIAIENIDKELASKMIQEG